MHRRQYLAAATGVAAGLAGCTGDGTDDGTGDATTAPPDGGDATTTQASTASATQSNDRPDAVGLDALADGLDTPVDAAFASEGDVQYVAEQRGVVRVLADGDLRSTPLLDVRDGVVTGYEMGLLGLALHPDFAENRRLFVRYSAPSRRGTPDEYSHTFVLAEFRVGDDGLTADPDSERTVLTIPQPQSNHNAGSLVFGPEGSLYVGVGDGGAANDQGRGHVDDWYDAVDGGNGQDVIGNLLGSVLRIDVGDERGGDRYTVPNDNPLVGSEGLDEHYAWGFRNPWRLAFDGADLYAGDVGQNRYEEVNVVRAGGNYGWNVREGTHCFGAEDCPDGTPDDVRGGEPLRDPVVEYPHEDAAVSGVSVITGNVYRGSAVPGLRGAFVFGDLRANGRLFVAEPRDSGEWPTSVLPVADEDAGRLSQAFSFQRHDGELYVLGSGDAGGGLYRLRSA
ncbi:PQQ-dependent sugar dehydrogenase [Halobacterium yunchengense]|uniref:PQQ-dependent sugar dehydrogenase n=1 Tax=Halobacterium yunchengense TaxID=3108497 RepID=UPI003009DC2E